MAMLSLSTIAEHLRRVASLPEIIIGISDEERRLPPEGIIVSSGGIATEAALDSFSAPPRQTATVGVVLQLFAADTARPGVVLTRLEYIRQAALHQLIGWLPAGSAISSVVLTAGSEVSAPTDTLPRVHVQDEYAYRCFLP